MTAETTGPDDSGGGLPGPLPEAVRARVVALAADALGRIPADQLPAALKRVASFAPARRARLAGTQIAGVLETDDKCRDRVALEVKADLPELADALESGTTPAAADPVDVAAVAYLLRPDDWVSMVSAAAEVAGTEQATAESQRVAQQVDRLERQLEQALADLRDTRERNRRQVADLKAENADLRRKLGDTRSRARSAEAEARAAEEAAAEAEAAAATAGSASDAEIRRLRARVEELERDLATARRSERVEKESGTLRARLLLDTLLDTAQGLRRELALPAVEGSPADLVEADVAEQGSRTPSGAGSLAVDDPALLEQLLALPRVHLVVDGYNVTKTAWPESSLEAQRDRLMQSLAPLVARTRAEVTVVFDAADKAERPVIRKPRGVRVLFSPVGVIADDVIRQLVSAEPTGRPVVVVSSDQAVVRDVTREGARAVASSALSRLLSRS